ncbi:hypothetical protein MIND_00487900 [Mycena indigotica]|uniref:Uncharacterized protein n=1 Tax=Mycena indigotica TaxID=2126181 RepID=A0A8H6SWZ6_9AGAR|nr:uncharacterized protein MIND_00487900 [Mycena indigotica]KAF7306951.1 hypothetical protein MIND_00487900 [Mycena indigotica]
MHDHDWRQSAMSSSPVSEHTLSTPSLPHYALPRIQSPSSPVSKDDYRLSWDPPVDSKISLPSFRSLFAAPSDDEEHHSTEYYASSEPEVMQDEDEFLTDSDDEPQHSYFYNSHIRFNISAERGRWKSDPLPRHAVLRLAARTTSPTPSPAPSAVPVQRNISEPAPTVASQREASSEPQLPPSSSPILSHSSPILSPISLSVSPMVGSVSPLSVPGPLSPLSLPPSSIAGDHDMDLLTDDEMVQQPTEDTDIGLGLLAATSAESQESPVDVIVAETSPSIPAKEPESLVQSAKVDDHVLSDLDIPMLIKVSVTSHEESRDESTESEPSRDGKAKNETADKGKKRVAQSASKVDTRKAKKARTVDSTIASRAGGSSNTRSRDTKSRRRESRDSKPKSSRSEQRNKSKKSRASPQPEIDPELCGMLIECLATSRASSLPTSALFKSIMQSYPSVKSRGTEEECLELMERILESGTVAAGGSGVFGKVERETSDDDSERVSEEQWFYQSERDPDQDRAQLFVSIRPAKRAETKKFKNYFYKPLERISRWDPEDAL